MGKEGRQTKTSLTRLGDIEETEEGLDTSEQEKDIPGMISKAEDEALQQWLRVYEQVCEEGDGSDSNMENREWVHSMINRFMCDHEAASAKEREKWPERTSKSPAGARQVFALKAARIAAEVLACPRSSSWC